jgi:hypothetical protein
MSTLLMRQFSVGSYPVTKALLFVADRFALGQTGSLSGSQIKTILFSSLFSVVH